MHRIKPGAMSVRSIVIAAGIAIVAITAAVPRAFAADGSWNGNFAGNWTTGTNWLGSVIPGSTSSTTSADIASFGFSLSAGRTVTVDANRNIGGILFSNTSGFGYTLSGGSLLLSNGGVIQTAANNGAHTDTVSSAITIQGVGGSGTFTAGATNASSLLSIGAVTGVSTAGNTSTLTLNGSNTGGNAVTGVIGNGAAGGRLAVVKSGNGVWRLSGTNTFSGGLTLNSGTLVLASQAALGTGTFTIAGGALDASIAVSNTANSNVQAWNGNFTFVGTNTLNLGTGAVTLGVTPTVTVSGSALTVGGVISGAGFGITKAGAGELRISGTANTYTGVTTINQGRLVLTGSSLGNGGAASPLGASSNAAANLIIDGGTIQTLNAQATLSTDRLFTIGTGGATLDSSGGNTAQFNFTNTGSIAFQGSGSRTLTLTSQGVRAGSFSPSLGDGPGGATSLVKSGSNTWTVNGNLTFTGGLTVTSGALNLAGTPSFSGGVNVSGGALNLTGTQNNFSGGVTIGASGTLGLNVDGLDFSQNVTNDGTITTNQGGSTAVTLSGVISGTGSINTADGNVTIGNVNNSYTGITRTQTGAAARSITVSKLADGGQNSSIGASSSAASNLVFGAGSGSPMVSLTYTGTGDSTNRLFTVSTSGMSGGITNNGTGPLSFTNTGAIAYGTSNVVMGVQLSGSNTGNNTFAPTISDNGTAAVYFTKGGVGRWELTAANSFSGPTTIDGGQLVVSSLNSVVGGSPTSSLGAPTNAINGTIAFNVSAAAAATELRYVGPGETTDRAILFRNATGAARDVALDQSGAGLLKFTTAVSSTMTSSGGLSMVLRGSTSGTGELAGGFSGDNSATGTSTAVTSLKKEGTGTWIISAASDYRGSTTVSGGVLRLDAANALPGGIGSTGGSSALTINGGVIGLGNDNFARGLGTGTNQVQITGGGGFAAYGADRTVNLGGSSGTATWGSGSFLTTAGGTFALGAANATHMVDFQNPVALGASGTTRTLRVDDGSGATDAKLSGILSGSGNLTKIGAGVAWLSGANTLTGTLTIGEGVVTVDTLSGTASANPLGRGAVVLGTGATAGTLRYTGGTTNVTRPITLGGSAGGTIDAAGTGPLTLSGVFGTGVRTLTLGGTSTWDNAMGAITDSGSSNSTTVAKAGSGRWLLSSATSNFTGGVQVHQGELVLAASTTLAGEGSLGAEPATGPSAVVGSNSLTGTAALLLQQGITVGSRVINVAGSATQVAILGGSDTSGTATFAGTTGSEINLARDVRLQAGNNGTVVFNNLWSFTGGSGRTVSVGSAGNTGRVVLSGSLGTTGAVNVNFGTLAVNGSLPSASAVTVASGAVLGGSGLIGSSLGGDGLIAPGNSPGILQVDGQVIPTANTAFAFEFTQTGDPTWSNATASVNDVLRLTNASPFQSSLASTNIVSVYFDVASLVAGATFRGGFYSDKTSGQLDFTGAIGAPTYAFFVYGDGNGSATSYNGKSYYTLTQYDPSLTGVTTSVVTAPTANYANGTVTDGQVTQFVVVPEPATLALAAIGIGLGGWAAYRRRRK